jgi:hypothetical protein
MKTTDPTKYHNTENSVVLIFLVFCVVVLGGGSAVLIFLVFFVVVFGGVRVSHLFSFL